MRDMLQFYIDGQWVDPVNANPLDVINPATEEARGWISMGGVEDGDQSGAAAVGAALQTSGCPAPGPMGARAAARHFNISRGTVEKARAFSIPPGYRRTAAIKRPKLDGFTEIIDAWLEADKAVHRKQRHTAQRASWVRRLTLAHRHLVLET